MHMRNHSYTSIHNNYIYIYFNFHYIKVKGPKEPLHMAKQNNTEQNIMMANIVEDGRNVNRYLFSCVGVGVTVLRISAGREFQRVRAATLKDLYPKVCRCVRSGLGVNEI